MNGIIDFFKNKEGKETWVNFVFGEWTSSDNYHQIKDDNFFNLSNEILGKNNEEETI